MKGVLNTVMQLIHYYNDLLKISTQFKVLIAEININPKSASLGSELIKKAWKYLNRELCN